MRTPTKSALSRARLVVLAVIGAIVTASLVPTGAAFAGPIPSPSPSPKHPTLMMGSFKSSAYAGQAAHLPAGLSVALKRDLNETPAEYLADAAAAAQAVKVVAALKGAGVHVLGSRIRGTRLTVNVASSADAAQVAATGATVAVGAPVAPDFSHKIFHSVSAATPTYGGQGYFFQSADQIGTTNGFRCSIGFSGYSVSASTPQFLSAGHCATVISGSASLITQDGPTNYGGTATVTSTALGATVSGEAKYGSGMDYGIVGEGSSVAPQAALYTWGGGTGSPLSSAPLPVVGQTAALVGANLCKSGSTSGWTCGSVLAVDTATPVCEPDESDTDCATNHTVNSIVATTCLLPGDSGGGAVIGQLAAGIDSGSDFPVTSCSNPNAGTASGHESVFFPFVSAGNPAASVGGQVGSNWKLLAAPVVTSPTAGATVSAGATMTGTLFNGSSANSISLFLDGSSAAAATVAVSAGTWSVPLSGLGQGSHTYSLMETFGGNQVAVVPGSFVEAVTSTASVSYPPSNATLYSDSVMKGTISTPLPTSTALVYLDGSATAYAQVSASSGSFSVPLTGISVGNHYFTVAAGIGSASGPLSAQIPFTEGAPNPGRDAIAALYTSLGGASGSLGAITTLTQPAGVGFREDFASGSILWSAATGAFVVSGGELTAYTAAGGPLGSLGWPASGLILEPQDNGGGSAQVFQNGWSIYASPAGAFPVGGAIRTAYFGAGGSAGFLGWPTAVQSCSSGGSPCTQTFQNGTVSSTG